MDVYLDATWLAIGTSRGFILLWDCRFQLLLKIWRHPSCRTIESLVTVPAQDSHTTDHQSRPWVYVTARDGAHEAAAFDLTTGACVSQFRIFSTHATASRSSSEPYSNQSSTTGLLPIPLASRRHSGTHT